MKTSTVSRAGDALATLKRENQALRDAGENLHANMRELDATCRRQREQIAELRAALKECTEAFALPDLPNGVNLHRQTAAMIAACAALAKARKP